MPEINSINTISEIMNKQKAPMTCINNNAENELICQKKHLTFYAENSQVFLINSTPQQYQLKQVYLPNLQNALR